jgi:hypothetical protein
MKSRKKIVFSSISCRAGDFTAVISPEYRVCMCAVEELANSVALISQWCHSSGNDVVAILRLRKGTSYWEFGHL